MVFNLCATHLGIPKLGDINITCTYRTLVLHTLTEKHLTDGEGPSLHVVNAVTATDPTAFYATGVGGP
jgi:hypothetical protein